jgi:hypothetical protein
MLNSVGFRRSASLSTTPSSALCEYIPPNLSSHRFHRRRHRRCGLPSTVSNVQYLAFVALLSIVAVGPNKSSCGYLQRSPRDVCHRMFPSFWPMAFSLVVWSLPTTLSPRKVGLDYSSSSTLNLINTLAGRAHFASGTCCSRALSLLRSRTTGDGPHEDDVCCSGRVLLWGHHYGARRHRDGASRSA